MKEKKTYLFTHSPHFKNKYGLADIEVTGLLVAAWEILCIIPPPLGSDLIWKNDKAQNISIAAPRESISFLHLHLYQHQ